MKLFKCILAAILTCLSVSITQAQSTTCTLTIGDTFNLSECSDEGYKEVELWQIQVYAKRYELVFKDVDLSSGDTIVIVPPIPVRKRCADSFDGSTLVFRIGENCQVLRSDCFCGS